MADSVVVFNELQYHPASPTEPEWIELHNQMAYDVDLSKWKIRGGVDFDFPNGTIVSAGGFLLVSNDPGAVPNALGPWSGNLSNGGESLRLRNNSNRLMDEISYGDSGVWPIGADGSGATLAKADPESATAFPGNWRASAEIGGTPGAVNFPESTQAGPDLPLIAIGGTWRYNETGDDLGANWAASAHLVDNVDWFSGPALLGHETTPAQIPEVIQTALENPVTNAVVTYYFETDFELNAAQLASVTGLEIRHVIDDGAVFYLNGVEVGTRFNLTGGAIDASTTASPSVSNAAYEGPFSLPANGLVEGTNRFSVEVHQQAPNSSDIVFGLALTAMTQVAPTMPLEIRINEISGTGEPTFQFELHNAGPTPIELEGYVLESQGAVDAEYVFPQGVSIQNGGFLVIDETIAGFRPQNDDRLFIYSPNRQCLLDAVRADDQPRARSEAHGGRMLVPDAASFGGGNSFSISTDVVINEIMYHFREDPGSGPGAEVETTFVAMDGAWRYNQSGADLGSNWAQTAHPVDNVDWFEGPALLGAETTPQALPEPIRTPFADPRFNGTVTYYLETDFTVTADQVAGLQLLRLRHIIDDGAVFYLNGVEWERFNIEDGIAVTASTTATTVSNAASVTMLPLPPDLLVEGTNRLSVELHQDVPNSSDVIFGAELIGVEIPPERPLVERDEEWIELHNKSGTTVNLTGWSIDGGIDFNFPDGTMIDAGGFLVVTHDAATLAAKYPALAPIIVGDYQNRLNNSRDTIRLEDPNENPVDEVTYYDGGRWSSLADGNGSSLELRDPDADNTNGDAWAPSDESGKSAWETITYRGTGGQSYGLTAWNEFRLGMLRAGQVLIDDVSVVRDPDGAAEQLIQNGDFSSGTDKWRLLGNHRHSTAISEPGNPGNIVLLLDARGATDTRHNHLETTFINNTAISSGQTYEVSYRARWLAGSNQVNTRCYYQRLARTTQIDRPENCGTPGAANSRVETNIGPTFRNLRHDPPVPAANEAIAITAEVSDPDGLADFVLKVRTDEGPVENHNFLVGQDGRGSGVIPGKPVGSVIQFWIEALDVLGATSMAPTGGADSRALIQVADGQGTNLDIHEMRIVMLDSERDFMLTDLNLMSNERIGGTVIYNQREIFYDVGVRLRGSGAGRARDGPAFRGFNIAYNADQLFRGVQSSTSIDRSARTPVPRQQHEIYVKHMFNHAGIPCMYDELVYLIGPSSTYTGTSQMLMAGYGGMFTETQFPDGGDGSVFNLDITYDPVSSIGGTEGPKPPVPFQHIGSDFENRGDSEEDYRTWLEVRTGRRRDDYSGLIRFCKAMDLSGAAFESAIAEVMDIDEWLRYMGMTLLCGIGDSYVSGGLPHNIRVYVPEDGNGVAALPWDMDFVFSSGATSSMEPGGGVNLQKVFSIPKYNRLYWGHVHDMVTNTFNTSYMNTWLAHYGGVLNQNFTSQAGYISARGNHALSRLPGNVPFSIVTNGGNDFSVDGTVATLLGKGWINVREFRLAGSDEPLAVEWLDDDTWQLTLPVLPGPNPIALEVFDFQGELIETANLTITSTVTAPQPVDFLRITELNYHPAGDDNAEFIEFRNIGTETIDIGGVTFTEGVDFTFAANTMLAPGAFALAVRDRGSFETRYGIGLPIAGEYTGSALRNGGELLDLRDASGNVIHRFAYSDAWYPSTDGGGYTLVVQDENAGVADWETPEGWGISGDLHGNPGTANAEFATEFAAWQREHFTEAEQDDPSISGPSAILAGDGWSNLLKYALGLDPRIPVTGAVLPVADRVGDRLRLAVRTAENAVDLQIAAEFSGDASTWIEVLVPLEDAIDNGDGTETLVFEDSVPSGDVRFGRTRATMVAP